MIATPKLQPEIMAFMRTFLGQIGALQKKVFILCLSLECWAFQRFLQVNNPLIKGSYRQWRFLEVHPYPLSHSATISTGGEPQGAIRQGIMTGRVLQGATVAVPVTMGNPQLTFIS